MTPDTDLVIDADGPLVVACGCSGHAFKFGPALGELVADVARGIDCEERAMFSTHRPAMCGGPHHRQGAGRRARPRGRLHLRYMRRPALADRDVEPLPGP